MWHCSVKVRVCFIENFISMLFLFLVLCTVLAVKHCFYTNREENKERNIWSYWIMIFEFCKFRKLPNHCIKLDLGGFTEPSSYPVCFFQFHFTVAACCEHLSLLIAIVCLPLLCECVFFSFITIPTLFIPSTFVDIVFTTKALQSMTYKFIVGFYPPLSPP